MKVLSIIHRIVLYIKGSCDFFRFFVVFQEISDDTLAIIKGDNYISSFRI